MSPSPGTPSKSGFDELDYPVRDAGAVAEKLKELGFKVAFKPDLTKSAFQEVLEAFFDENKGADFALVYYAGHAVQIGGENFLVPTDVNYDNVETLNQSSMPLEPIFQRSAEMARVGSFCWTPAAIIHPCTTRAVL